MRGSAGGRRSWRWLVYVGAAAGIVICAVHVNRRPAPEPEVRMDVDPQVAVHQGRHNHEKLGTACLCDPEAEIEQALKDRADYAEVHLDLGDRFYARGQYDYAVDCYRRAIELNPDLARAHYGLGLSLTRLQQFDEASAALAEAVEIDPGMVDAYLSLGILEYRAGNFDSAQRQWRAALTIDPENTYAQELLGRVPTVKRLTRGL